MESGFESTENEREHGHWIGMNNVNRRLKLLYGESFGIEIESEAGVYTKVALKLPSERGTSHV